jgi:hypothetical protein
VFPAEMRENVRKQVFGDRIWRRDANGASGAAVAPGEPPLEFTNLQAPSFRKGVHVGSGFGEPEAMGRALEKSQAHALLDPLQPAREGRMADL